MSNNDDEKVSTPTFTAEQQAGKVELDLRKKFCDESWGRRTASAGIEAAALKLIRSGVDQETVFDCLSSVIWEVYGH